MMAKEIKIHTPLGFSDFGQRDVQQDCTFPSVDGLSADDRLFVICDGMGGHSHGEIASKTIIDSIIKQYNSATEPFLNSKKVKVIIETAWSDLDSHYNPEFGDRQMGTTIAFLHLATNKYIAAHIGDSRIYHIRPAKVTEIIYRSIDHTHVSALLSNSDISPIDALKYDNKNILNKALIPHTRYDADIYESNDIQIGDYFMLCSDGVVENLTEEMIRFIFSPYRSPEEIFELIHLHCQQLSLDNNSCIIIPIADICNNTDITQLPANEKEHSLIWQEDELLKESIKLLNNNKR